MKKLIVGIILGAVFFGTPASAQYVTTCGNCQGQIVFSSGCCVTVVNDDSYAAVVAKWAVEMQMRNWLPKKSEDLTRDDIKAARTKLDVLCTWAKDKVENKVFSTAYLNWASSMKSTLDSASVKLDHDDIAKTLLLHGLPALPPGAK